MTLYAPGEDVRLVADIFPGTITPYPLGILPTTRDNQPMGGHLFRVLITGRGLVVGWQSGGMIHRADIATDTSAATFRGMDDPSAEYTVTLNGACRCQARMLSTWDKSQIFPGSMVNTDNTIAAVIRNTRDNPNYGLIPTRYSRA